MIKEKARIVLLEDALVQAQNTVTFLHECLTDPKAYRYVYPDQTRKHLKKWNSLVPIPDSCFHSGPVKECFLCKQSSMRRRKVAEAKATLQITEME